MFFFITVEKCSCGPEITIGGRCSSSEYAERPNVFHALSLINISTMAPLVFPRALPTLVSKGVSKLSTINASGGFPSQLSLCFDLGEQLFVLASSLPDPPLFFI